MRARGSQARARINEGVPVGALFALSSVASRLYYYKSRFKSLFLDSYTYCTMIEVIINDRMGRKVRVKCKYVLGPFTLPFLRLSATSFA